LNLLKRTINDVFCNRLLAGQHQYVDELGDINIAELWIRQDFPFGNFTTTWHFDSFQSSVERAAQFTARSRIVIITIHLLGPFGTDTFSA
jgi:hypothetical protein